MADANTGSSGTFRLLTGLYPDAVNKWTDVGWELYLVERVSSPSTFGSASFSVEFDGGIGTVNAGSFGFDWSGGGLQTQLIAQAFQRINHNSDGTPPAGVVAAIGHLGSTGTSGAGGPTDVASYFALQTLKVAPAAPTACSAVRLSDTSVSVSWTPGSSASNGQPTTYTVRRKINNGAFADAVTVAPTTSTNVSAAANQKLEYSVKATNTAGVTSWSPTSTAIYTTPAAPTSVVATKSGSDIVLTWTSNVAFTEHTHKVEESYSADGGVTWSAWSTLTSTVTSGTSTYTHVAPNAAQQHKYQISARNTATGNLTSTAVASNVVVLLTAPAKPGVGTPPAFADRAATFRFAWAHNPVDSSAQTKHQTRYSTNGGSSWTTASKTTSTNQYLDYAASTFTANQQVLFQVRTKGAYDAGSDADASYSPWSDSVTVTFKSKPVVTITTPANASTYTQAALNVILGFSQPESATFVSAKIGLYASGGVTLLEEIDSTTLAGTAFTTRLADLTSYVIKATVTDSNGITSAQVSSSFSVDYIEPVAAVVVLTYLPDPGWVQIGLTIPAAGGGLVAATSVTIDRIIDGVTENIVTNYPSAPTLSILDTTPTILGTNTYKVTTRSVDGATSVVTTNMVTTEGEWAFLSSGSGYSTVVRFRSNLEVSAAPSRESTLIRTAGRVQPRALFGVGQGLDVSGSATLFDGGPESTPREIEEFILDAEIVCYRDPTGRRIFGVLTGAVTTPSKMMGSFSFNVTETV